MSKPRLLAERLRPLEQKRKRNDRETLYQSAQSQLARHDYSAALAQLRLIPVEVRTPQLVKLINETDAKAAESAWLRRDLLEAVVYDEHLLPIAERLLKLHPKDQELNKLIDRLREKAAAIGKQPNAKSDWPRPPAKSTWGPPLEAVSAFRRIDTAAIKNVPAFQDGCDRFCVAAGLALQGLGKGLIGVNLIPPEKTSLLGRFRSKKTPTFAWGIDVGRAAIKAMRLSCPADDGRIVADTALYLEHADLLNAPNAKADELLATSLDELLKRNEFRDAMICVGLAAHKVLYRPIALPLVDEKKLAELMKFEVREQIPFATDQVVWGYQPLGSRPTEFATVQEWDVALMALKVDEAHAAVAPFRERGTESGCVGERCGGLNQFCDVREREGIGCRRNESENFKGSTRAQRGVNSARGRQLRVGL